MPIIAAQRYSKLRIITVRNSPITHLVGYVSAIKGVGFCSIMQRVRRVKEYSGYAMPKRNARRAHPSPVPTRHAHIAQTGLQFHHPIQNECAAVTVSSLLIHTLPGVAKVRELPIHPPPGVAFNPLKHTINGLPRAFTIAPT